MDKESLETGLERTVVGFVLAALVFGVLATGAVRPGDFLFLEVFTVLATLAWVAWLFVRRSPRILWPPVAWAVLAFVMLAIVRYRQADIEYVARQELVRILIYALVFTLVLNLARRQEMVQVVLFTLVILGTLEAMYGIYQFATNSPRVWHFFKPDTYLGRASGTFINPNHLAGFLEMLFPVALAFAIRGRVAPPTRVLLGYAALVMLAGIATSVSRAGWLAAGVSTVILGLWLSRRWWQRLLIAATLATALIITATVFAHQVDRVKRRLADPMAIDNPQSSRIRLWLWEASGRMWLDHPWWGVGPAHFDPVFPRYRPDEIQARAGYAHNDYLNLLAEWGVAGFLLVAGAAGAVTWSTRRSWKHVVREADLGSRTSNREAAVIGTSAGLIALLVHSFADFNLQIPANALTAVTLFAILASHVRYATERFWVGGRLPARLLIALGCLAAAGYISAQTWKLQHELRWLNRAQKAGQTTPAGVDALKQAFAADPDNAATAYLVGEALRLQSWQGDSNYRQLAREALDWFDRAGESNPFDAYPPLRRGMCLDWLGQHDEATAEYDRALALDPRNYYVLALRGWHSIQAGNLVEAREWLEKSLAIQNQWNNPIAKTYLAIVKRQLQAPPPKP